MRLCQGALHDRNQFLQVEGLGDIFEGASFRRLHRGEQRVLGAHHDDPQFRAQLADPRNQVEPVLVGHHHIGDHDVAFSLGHPAPQCRGIAGCPDLVPQAAERLNQNSSDRAIVVGDKDGRFRHAITPFPRPSAA